MGKKSNIVLYSALIAGLSGLLMGFNTAVISGVEKSIQQIFSLNQFWQGFTVAIAIIGAMLGALTAGKPADLFGRKQTLFIIALLFLLSGLGSALSNHWTGFLIYRFLGGLAVGAATIVGPMYIAEISPAEKRGRLVLIFQINVVTGLLLAYISNYVISLFVEQNAWRWMLSIQTIPAILFITFIPFIPQTPRWLLIRNEREKAIMILEKLGEKNAEEQISIIEKSLNSEKALKSERLFTKQLTLPIVLAILVAFFNQFSGINAIMYYAPRIFEISGLNHASSLFQSITLGLTNLIFTLLASLFIDKIGRKKLLMIGSVGMVVMLTLVAVAFIFEKIGGTVILLGLIGFLAFFASSQGAVIWVYISEIFPNKVRAKGQTLGGFTHWILAAFISWLFPVITKDNSIFTGYAFAFFALMMLIQFIVVKKLFPETKGKALEQIQNEFGL
ncbi:MAG TPA: sugar porter family MFS transporter [Bacteroidales bacterium]|nr:MFS transporter [Bacteroidales bacterium]HQG36217.1 sugar porter family MFS transporter [Bacteroidales bacterium]HQG53531.1 sugar porter family MFS transporter [Bacteroidales bacterium]HRC88876.1 sugar porter family MFS transporter [Bacteroidales bacterium]